ncbi:unnamed protein product [Pylaiella littoralis]
MAPPEDSNGVSMGQQQVPAAYTTEPKRMRLSGAATAAAAAATAAAGSSTTTRASTGAPTAMTNKGSVYKAQRGRAVTAAAVKAKAPITHRRRGRRGKSVYRGVCVTREGKWRAVIYKERKQLYLGVYESEVDAAKAHDRAARFHFAESAVCNFDNEHEADRQAEIHKQRQLVQQQQLAEDRAHHAQLHGGSFSVGREEFDDLEEYHRGMDEATCSSEDGEGMDEALHGEDEEEEEVEEEEDDGREYDLEGGDTSGEGRDADGYEDDGIGRSNRSMSNSYSSAMSTGSMSDEDGGGGHGSGSGGHHRSRSAGNSPRCEVTLAAAAVATAAINLPAAVPFTAAVAEGGEDGTSGNSDFQIQQQRSRCSSGESDCSSDFVTSSALMREVSQSSSTQEGMGFPVAEDLLGYEMQSWYCCQDDEDRSPASSGAAPFDSQLKQQQPFMGRQQQSEELWGSAVGANLGWGFGDFAHAYSDTGGRASSGSMTSSSLSYDDDYVPSALPPLMGMSAAEA